MDSRVVTSYEKVIIATCCSGYTETPNRQCAPICLNSCVNGKCVAPNVCECNPTPSESSPGFVGSSCNRYTCLAENRWGSKCDKECNCPANSYCSASTGKCLCRTGWRGANCTEECESSMNCHGVELPPIIEPDTNVIPDDQLAAQKLVLSQYRDNDDGSSLQSSFNWYATNVSTHLFLISLIAFLFYAAIKYKQRYDKVRNELYYSGTTGSGSNYSVYSRDTNGGVQNRPRMPAPHEANFLAKNLSFATATRNIVLKGEPEPIDDGNKTSKGAKSEARLSKCQLTSKPNIYSDIDVNRKKDDSHTINMGDQLNVDTVEESHYLVPRSPVASPQIQNEVDVYRRDSDLYENDADNLYEEIKPRLPPANDIDRC